VGDTNIVINPPNWGTKEADVKVLKPVEVIDVKPTPVTEN
jgi:hypothetical protein